ncbi:MAG: nucleotidyltransferase domain-containing protein [Candidatus Pacearchaeota archaeon]|jgi:predicted nucleotidyltransferase/uncharacterized protein (UPF0332 family)
MKIKKVSKKSSVKSEISKKSEELKENYKQEVEQKRKQGAKKYPTLQLKTEKDIAMDFAVKAYKTFDKIIKSIVLFGSVAKKKIDVGSDIDIILILDDASVKWDQELIAWYREELDKILRTNPYSADLHINTVKLSTWWEDLLRGDPIVLNILRYGEAMIDVAGFFNPLKYLLIEGKIKPTPEAIYSCLQRAPIHLARSRGAELGAIEGIYWSMVDSAHAALISARVIPPSPEHIARNLKETFVDPGRLKAKYIIWYRDLLFLHKQIEHGEMKDVKGAEIDVWQQRAQEFLEEMVKIVKENI